MDHHQSIIPTVKCNIDAAGYLAGGSFLIRGWTFNTAEPLTKLRIATNESIFEIPNCNLSRPDVLSVYGNTESEFSGFEIQLPSKDVSKRVHLQGFINDRWLTIQNIHTNAGLADIPDDLNKDAFNKIKPDFLVVDNFYKNPDAVREFALTLEFKEQKEYFKGQRTDQRYIIDGTKEKFEALLNREITDWTHGMSGRFQFCTANEPIVYHYDSQSFAAIVYLTPEAPPETGTSFFRRKSNGLYTFPTEEEALKLNKPIEQIQKEIYDDNAVYDRTKWELVDLVGNRYNRLIIFDAKLFHAANAYFGGNLTDSRLFHIFFFDAI